MCSLFGLIDYQNALTTRQKNHILQVLAKECEVRGTDATGIAYNFGGSIKVYKRPLAAHKLKFHVPNGVHVVMGPVSYTHLDVYKRQMSTARLAVSWFIKSVGFV